MLNMVRFFFFLEKLSDCFCVPFYLMSVKLILFLNIQFSFIQCELLCFLFLKFSTLVNCGCLTNKVGLDCV